MEFLDSGDSVKEQLRERAAQKRQQFQEEARSLTSQAEKVLTNGLMIAGALAITYWVFTAFSGGQKKKKKQTKTKATALADVELEEGENSEPLTESPGVLAGVGSALATQAGLFLLDIAKDRLRDYLAKRGQEKTDENT